MAVETVGEKMEGRNRCDRVSYYPDPSTSFGCDRALPVNDSIASTMASLWRPVAL